MQLVYFLILIFTTEGMINLPRVQTLQLWLSLKAKRVHQDHEPRYQENSEIKRARAYRRPLVQALLPGDIDKRVKWAEDYLEAAERDFTYPDYILWTDEAIFHLDGHVKRHNAVIWSVQNPHALMECSNQRRLV